jgi:hypothetical protein
MLTETRIRAAKPKQKPYKLRDSTGEVRNQTPPAESIDFASIPDDKAEAAYLAMIHGKPPR